MLVSKAVDVDEGRRYLTALVTLDGDALRNWAQTHGRVADSEAVAGDPDPHEEIARVVEEVNVTRSRVEQIRNFRILLVSCPGGS
jgi:long-chain acyl-CoA synthetase